jgi:hypothetical protein
VRLPRERGALRRVSVSPEWSSEEQLYRESPRVHAPGHGGATRRSAPKRGYLELSETQRFVPDDRMSS